MTGMSLLQYWTDMKEKKKHNLKFLLEKMKKPRNCSKVSNTGRVKKVDNNEKCNVYYLQNNAIQTICNKTVIPFELY
jgi:hypothetical protein